MAVASQPQLISLSVVSHGQAGLLQHLLDDLLKLPQPERFELILTRNIPEVWPFEIDRLPFSVKVIENSQPKGFGANHNAAFRAAAGDWFCVLNPDVLLPEDPFPELLNSLQKAGAALAAPVVFNSAGNREDSARAFPTLSSLAARALGRDATVNAIDPHIDTSPDWLAGMFLLFRSDDFAKIGGFDEDFYLYYEDVDICARLRKAGFKLVLCSGAKVIHDAQRSSHHNWRYRYWHLASMLRYFLKHWWRLP